MMENSVPSSPAHWLEVSLTLDPELAEAVSEVLSRFVSNGVVVESGVKFNDAEDEGTPFGDVRVYGYIVADEHLEETRQRLEEALWFLGRIRPLPEPQFRIIQDEDWMAAWKQHYHPIPVGKRLLILPAWVEMDPGGREVVRIDPSMAFGTGTHPTTRLCMEAVEDHTLPERPAIDVGCGSGILSIAALKMGASHALAVDIDPASVKSTCENAEANGVLQGVETGLGSVSEILQGNFSLRRAPLVLANILAPILVRLFDAGLADLLEEGADSTLVLSGILDTQAADVEAAARRKGLSLVQTRQMADWVALSFRRL